MDSQPLIRNVSDTALWVATYRALESERPDALFRDPFARRLAGERGAEILARLRHAKKTDWAFVARTVAFDEAVQKCVAAGADLVVNLAAGLDTRPYRMSLPESLRWVEVDLPDLVAYKEQILVGEEPACRLERVPLDLANVEARRALFARLGAEARQAMVLSEGLIIYLEAEEVASLSPRPRRRARLPLVGQRPGLTRPPPPPQQELRPEPRPGRRAAQVLARRGLQFLRSQRVETARGPLPPPHRRSPQAHQLVLPPARQAPRPLRPPPAVGRGVFVGEGGVALYRVRPAPEAESRSGNRLRSKA